MELDEASQPSGPETSGVPGPGVQDRTDPLRVRIHALGTAMLILASAGLGLFLINHGRALSELLVEPRWTIAHPDMIFLQVEPIELVRTGWPLLFALAFWWLRWPRLALGAAVTLLVLAADRFLGLVIAFETARHPGSLFVRLGPAGDSAFLERKVVASLVVAAVFMLFFAVLGARALLLDREYRRRYPASVRVQPRKAWMIGRMAVLGSVVFGVLLFGARVWSVYDKVLLSMPAFRRLVLRSDPDLERGAGNLRPRPDPVIADLREALIAAIDAQAAKRFPIDRVLYARVIAGLDNLPQSPMSPYYRPDMALLANNLAWSLATASDPAGRDPVKAVALAKQAVSLLPSDGNSWNTLGVAFYRAHAWKEARVTLKRSMGLRDGGDSFDWYFMAMVAFQDGQRDDAREWYDRAVAWTKANRPYDAELYRFRQEAADLLQLDDPEAHEPPATPPRSPVQAQPRRFPRVMTRR